MSSNSSNNLFKPIPLGNLVLSHRVVMAPLARLRADVSHVHRDPELGLKYYSQRASVPGTLIIAEGTIIAPQGGGINHVPHIFTDAQIYAWKKITDAVHARRSFIYLQLYAMGRVANAEILATDGFSVVGPSAIPVTGASHIPRSLTTTEIKEYVELYRDAASNAVHKAGFDGVEIHLANGYLLDQFLQDVSNSRTDEYGGSIENRCRFPLEVIDAVVNAVGQERTGVRLSPWSPFQDMRMRDPKPTFSYLAMRINELYPNFSYLHVIEPRISGGEESESVGGPDMESNDFLREIWKPKPYIAAGGFTRQSAMEASDRTGELIAFGRMFISNPDLPTRLIKDIPLKKGDRSYYYTPMEARGYIDYPFATVVAYDPERPSSNM